MSDLISRSELLKSFHKCYSGHLGMESSDSMMTFKSICRVINQHPASYDVDNVVEELEMHSFEFGTDTLPAHYVRLNDAIEIVKQGVVSDDVCEWKLEDEEANLYLTECQQRQLIFDGTPKDNGYRYCPYCGKKIKVVE